MRHAARTPPPPDLIACGLLQLTLFRKLQNSKQSFEVSVRYYLFLAVFRQLSAGVLHCVWVAHGVVECKIPSRLLAFVVTWSSPVLRLLSGVYRRTARTLCENRCQESSKTYKKRGQECLKSITNHSKWDLGRFKQQLGRESDTKTEGGTNPTKNLSEFWRHLADFGRHFAPQWILKGSQNQAFWHRFM